MSSSSAIQTRLPTLLHPSSLIDDDETILYLNLQQARTQLRGLQSLRADVTSNSAGYQLDPPTDSALPPLPPAVPTVSSSYQPLPSSSKTQSNLNSSKRPNTRPPIPENSSLRSTSPRTLKRCVQIINHTGKSRATLRYQDSAVLLQTPIGNGTGSGFAWITLSRLKDDGSEEDGCDVSVIPVIGLKLYEGVKTPAIHSPCSSPQLQAVSDNLLTLDLRLPELLYRLPYLGAVLRQSCFYCRKAFRHPDGLPSRTGWVDPVSSATPLGEVNASKQISQQAEETGFSKGGSGQWVCWHPSCESRP